MQTLRNQMSTGTDVVVFLEEQHRQVRAFLEAVRISRGSERLSAFDALRRMLAVHETAEEIVHPAARDALAGGVVIAAERLAEERAVKLSLARIEQLAPDSEEFEHGFAAFELDVRAHLHAEETTEFRLLGDALDFTRLQRMQRAVAVSDSIPPPAPSVPRGANEVTWPFTSMVEEARDAIQIRK